MVVISNHIEVISVNFIKIRANNRNDIERLQNLTNTCRVSFKNVIKEIYFIVIFGVAKMYLCPFSGIRLKSICLYIFGIIFLAVGLFGTLYWPSWAEQIMDKTMILFENGPTFNKWSVTPIPIYTYLYLFNWTNPDQVRVPGVKPNFIRMGPYVFHEKDRKVDVTWNENETVSFKQQRTWYFEPGMSKGSLEDLITAPHLPTITAAEKMQGVFMQLILNSILNNHGGALYQTHTAREWLFEGFHDEFLAYIKNLANIPLIPEIPSEQFAWLLDRNNSKDFEGIFTINTGKKNVEEVGALKFWNGVDQIPFFEGECARVNGSIGDLFGPRITGKNPVTLFLKDACRSINLAAVGHTEVEGIKVIRFETQKDSFDSGAINPNMKCFCKEDNCAKAGVTNLGPCAMGAPAYLSHVNFKYADPSYVNSTTITSLPNPEDDIFYINIQPRLGIPLEANLALQLSIQIRPHNILDIFKDLPEFYAPAFVLNNKFRTSVELANEIKFGLNVPDIGFYSGVAFLILSVILFSLGIYTSLTVL